MATRALRTKRGMCVRPALSEAVVAGLGTRGPPRILSNACSSTHSSRRRSGWAQSELRIINRSAEALAHLVRRHPLRALPFLPVPRAPLDPNIHVALVPARSVGCAMGTCMGLMTSGQWAVRCRRPSSGNL